MLLGSDDLERDHGSDVLAQAHGGLVVTDGLDGRGDLDLALVERADALRLDGVSDVARTDGAEQTTVLAGLDRQGDGRVLELHLEVLCLFDGGELARGTRGTDRLDLLLAALGPRDSEALGMR
ncbi:hypothetical protein ARTHRO9V_1850001 [Arthrobacter sp. 9V]|nr:hypothetical protein ARTHRO9V_1850001 [Arthrobacter sp. 9V]